ncbi:MAG TPA: tRNA (adenosine(37)-N6)-dimethylallyltransferase MiaA [Ilumatobacteraceae bacterium]|nr:tRNA (adenosine(37)-N6)-dimethylallyltransferase MiaA [Ilumatobacteraceae bacterium]
MLGPTASGKSAVAMAAARQVGDVEIVSVDAMQVYRGMDIGTAKPTPADQADVRHHLIDIVDPGVEFAVAEFRSAAREALDDIARRDKRALLVAGTGLYHRVVIDDIELPGQWPDIRAELDEDAGRVGTPVLHARLEALDPVAAARMEPTNTRRVVRALEVCIGSGRPFSSFGPGLDVYPPSPIAQLGLRWPREVLARRIERRVQAMIDAGLVGEVRTLLERPIARTAHQALGYKELIDHVEGRCTLDAAVAAIVTGTRQLAVRQERWFRRDPRVRWIDIEADPVAEALPAVLDALAR